MPIGLEDMHIGNCSFIYMSLFEQAQRLAAIPLQEFLTWTEELEASNLQPKTLLFTNTSRCGSTLLGQMLNHPGASVVFCEHPSLTYLKIGLKNGYFTEKYVEQLLKATVTVLRKDVSPNQLCVLKTSSLEAGLAPILARVCPEVKHLFMFRKDGLISVERLLLRDLKTIETPILTLPFLWPLFSMLCVLERFTKGERSCLGLIKPRNIKEFAAVILASSYMNYLKNQEIYCVPAVYYEELINNPVTTLKPVFKALGLSEERIENAILHLKSDSQNNTFLSRDMMKNIKATEMDDSVVAGSTRSQNVCLFRAIYSLFLHRNVMKMFIYLDLPVLLKIDHVFPILRPIHFIFVNSIRLETSFCLILNMP